jgi:hypothetical protein
MLDAMRRNAIKESLVRRRTPYRAKAWRSERGQGATCDRSAQRRAGLGAQIRSPMPEEMTRKIALALWQMENLHRQITAPRDRKAARRCAENPLCFESLA